MAGLSPTERTLKELRNLRRKSGIVERFIHNKKVNPKGGIRSDLFGFIDIISLCPQDGIVAIQSCGGHYAEHFKKITEERKENALDWLNAGGSIEIWCWRKVKIKRGGKQKQWQPRITRITRADFP